MDFSAVVVFGGNGGILFTAISTVTRQFEYSVIYDCILQEVILNPKDLLLPQLTEFLVDMMSKMTGAAMRAQRRVAPFIALLCDETKSTFLPKFQRCMAVRNLPYTFGKTMAALEAHQVDLSPALTATSDRSGLEGEQSVRHKLASLNAVIVDSWSWNASRLLAFIEGLPDKGSSLEWLHVTSAGVDRALPAFRKYHSAHGVLCTRSQGSYGEDLAEYVLTAMLHFNKQIPRLQMNQSMRHYDPFKMNTMRGKWLGIVGYGDIGREIAKKAKSAFDIKVLALRRSGSEADGADELVVLGADENRTRRQAFLRMCDFVVSVLPHTEETVDFFGEDEFRAMKPTAAFVNIGRGSAVDEAALIRCLEQNVISGAALDVQRIEPLPTENPLWQAPNLLLSPHNADATDEGMDRAFRVFEMNLDCFLNGAQVQKDMHSPFEVMQGY